MSGICAGVAAVKQTVKVFLVKLTVTVKVGAYEGYHFKICIKSPCAVIHHLIYGGAELILKSVILIDILIEEYESCPFKLVHGNIVHAEVKLAVNGLFLAEGFCLSSVSVTPRLAGSLWM